MSKTKKMLLFSGVAAAAIGMAASMTTALADPPAGVTPKNNAIVGTGSDTTQLVLDQLSADWRKNHASAARQWYSFDATGSATIQEKVGCDPNRTRPNGSGAGIAELEANLRPSGTTGYWCVDYARSSRARQSTAPADPNTIIFLPFAIDGVTWSADKLTGTTHAPTSLTPAQLGAIYNCDGSTLPGGHSGPVTWKELGGSSSHQVIPVIPQSSSGTRSFFLKSIGVTTPGSCVVPTDNSVEENEGTNAIFQNTATAPDIIFPYSIAVYLAQTIHNHGTDQNNPGPLVLRQINKVTPTSGSGTSKKINANFPVLRKVYNVVRNAAKNPATAQTVPSYLQGIFGDGSGGTGWICTSVPGKADIQSFGFLPMSGGLCGKAE